MSQSPDLTSVPRRAWRFGDHIDTDAIVSSQLLSSSVPANWTKHVLSAMRPEFAQQVAPGDLLIAGERFGVGSAREHAVIALRGTGIYAVIAESFARNFYRSAFNNALLLIELPRASTLIGDGDLVTVDLNRRKITNTSTGATSSFPPVSPLVLEICRAGGLPAWLAGNGNTWQLRGTARAGADGGVRKDQ
jgi:3-isopropylmalate/(R)-2-methylmalate dehydratase small subunit